jgi:hypothetical protein
LGLGFIKNSLLFGQVLTPKTSEVWPFTPRIRVEPTIIHNAGYVKGINRVSEDKEAVDSHPSAINRLAVVPIGSSALFEEREDRTTASADA